MYNTLPIEATCTAYIILPTLCPRSAKASRNEINKVVRMGNRDDINIADGLGIDKNSAHLKVSSMDGHDEIAQPEGIEARVIVSLCEEL